MYCYKCMNEINIGSFCTHCMADNNAECAPHHLKPGTVLNNKYLVGKVIGEGGFGVTYIGRDTTLDIKVAIKEYYPNGFVNRNNSLSSVLTTTTEEQKDFFEKGKQRFLVEARSVAKFSNETGIVNIRDYFEQNGTAYIIMEYLDGMTLSDYVKNNGVMDATQLFALMKPIMKSLKKMHDVGIIHRDISPHNIMYLNDGTLKLMDFGSARYFVNEDKMLSVVLKTGYAPEEQYRKNGDQGPWTDVYAMCATIYYCITGVVPEDALSRLHSDAVVMPSQLGVNIPESLQSTLMYGLAVHKENRCKDMAELMALTDVAQNGGYVPQPLVSNTPTVAPIADIHKITEVEHNYGDNFTVMNPQPELTGKPPVYQPVPQATQQTYIPQPYMPPQQKKQGNGKFIAIIIAIIVTCMLICGGVVLYVFWPEIVGVDVPVPTQVQVTTAPTDPPTEAPKIYMVNCINSDYQEAQQELEALNIKVEIEYEFNNIYQKDRVFKQSVDAGEQLKEGDTVTLVVSKGTDVCPYDYTQKVVVSASKGSSNAKLKLYTWRDGDWDEDFSCSAKVGKEGISSNYGEGISATPQGTFKLGVLIATANKLDSFDIDYWPTYTAGDDTCVVDDPDSSMYNIITETDYVPDGTHYDLIGDGLTNGEVSALLFIEHNGDGYSSYDVVPNKGSVITICGVNGSMSATYGCIDISSSDLYTLMSELDYDSNPHIETTVK